MEMAPVIAGSVIAGKMGSSRGTIKPPTNEKVPTNGNKNNIAMMSRLFILALPLA